MLIKEIKGDRVFVESDTGGSKMQIWLDKEILRQYGIEFKDLKVGMVFDVKDCVEGGRNE